MKALLLAVLLACVPALQAQDVDLEERAARLRHLADSTTDVTLKAEALYRLATLHLDRADVAGSRAILEELAQLRAAESDWRIGLSGRVLDAEEADEAFGHINTMKIPRISMDDLPVSQAFAHLRQLAREQDPDFHLNLLLLMPPTTVEDALEPRITLDMDNIPLNDAIRHISHSAGLNCRWEEHAVLVADTSIPIEPLENVLLPADPGLADMPDFFLKPEGSPEGATAFYVPHRSAFLLRNTPANLKKILGNIRFIRIQHHSILLVCDVVTPDLDAERRLSVTSVDQVGVVCSGNYCRGRKLTAAIVDRHANHVQVEVELFMPEFPAAPFTGSIEARDGQLIRLTLMREGDPATLDVVIGTYLFPGDP